ncbi:hypothetical protein BC835DRAFT_1290111 [Cytidiella melzeri]|nr:hypothetical protein BC835DRAFT_1290111 [Cytidiella melzeri]
MSGTSTINYARADGIFKSELPGAIVFIALYIPLLIHNIIRSIRQPTYVLIMLAVFCTIRIAAFAMRAILAGSSTAGENLNLVVAEGVVYSVGFFGLLFSAYTLVLDRSVDYSGGGPISILRRFMRERRLIRLVLLIAVVCGIVGGTKAASSSSAEQNTGTTLRRVSVFIFLVITVMLVLITADFAWDEHKAGTRSKSTSFGHRYGLYVLTVIALLCSVREIFFAATSFNTKQQNNSHLWYPLAATPEFLAVCLFAVPGLVPSRAEIAAGKQFEPEATELYGQASARQGYASHAGGYVDNGQIGYASRAGYANQASYA